MAIKERREYPKYVENVGGKPYVIVKDAEAHQRLLEQYPQPEDPAPSADQSEDSPAEDPFPQAPTRRGRKAQVIA